MRLPEVRRQLQAIADYLERDHRLLETSMRLRALAAELRRRPAARNGRRVSPPMTPALRAQIIEMRRHHPHLTQMEIALAVGVNPGRISETLRGFRE